jgi:hypothetical protein
MAWQKTTKKISWKGMVEYHVLLVHSRWAWTFSFRFLLVEQLAFVYELSCSGLPWVDLSLRCPCHAVGLE